MGKGSPTKDPAGQKQLVQALVDALKANPPTPPPEPLPLPEFHGWDHEDPTKFLQECKLRLASTPKQLWLPKIANKLCDHALTWWQDQKELTPEYDDFESEFAEKYAGAETLTRLKGEFYSKKQQNKETAEKFLKRKALLAKRLFPDLEEDELTTQCRLLLRSEISKFAAFANPTKMVELIRGSTAVEASLPKATTNPTPTPAARGLPPCHFCPGRHYNRDCPNRPMSGNGLGDAHRPSPSGSSGRPQEHHL